METLECPRCRKPIAARRSGKIRSSQPTEFDETSGALVIVCAHYFLGGKCRERTVVSAVAEREGFEPSMVLPTAP